MPGSRRHVPERTCVGCGTKGNKNTLFRIAGRPGTGWQPDPGGRLPGRGIYLCRRAECIEGFMKRIRTEKGGARWKIGKGGDALAGALAAWWASEVKKAGGVDGES